LLLWHQKYESSFGIPVSSFWKKLEQNGGIRGASAPINAMFKKLIRFLREVRLELKKVSWPSRREISGSTGVVILSVVIVAIYLGILDNILQQIMMRLH